MAATDLTAWDVVDPIRISLLSLAMSSTGVPLGAQMPYQSLAS